MANEPVDMKWKVTYIGAGIWSYRVKKEIELFVCSELDDHIHFETNFTGFNRFSNGAYESPGYVDGLILKCIYVRDKSNINVHIVVIKGKIKYIVAITDTIENICLIDKNKDIQEYITARTIDAFFRNPTIDRLARIVNDHTMECDIGGGKDYIYLVPSDTNIIGDVRFDKIRPGLAPESNMIIDSLKRRRERGDCVII